MYSVYTYLQSKEPAICVNKMAVVLVDGVDITSIVFVLVDH